MNRLIACTVLALAAATTTTAAEDVTVTAEIWADNWFAMFAEGALVGEDGVPITTERSFNAETFTFKTTVPGVISILAKDFKENDTGLEYIGSRRQQMGDGGFIVQFKDGAGNLIGQSDADAKCMVLHTAPLDTSCADASNPVAGQGACGFEIAEAPSGWTETDFDDGNWAAAIEHSERAVRPKDGYDRIDWERQASLIWSADLERDNTLACRISIGE